MPVDTPSDPPPTALLGVAGPQVLQVPEGSIVVVTDGSWMDGGTWGEQAAGMAGRVGHDRFCLLVLGADGRCEVLGPDQDLAAEVCRVLDEWKARI